MNDQERWNRFLEGDQDALSRIFINYHDDLFNYGMKLVSDTDIVKDAIQDLFLKLWKNRRNLHPIQILKPYLFKALRRHIQDSAELNRPWHSIRPEEEAAFQVEYSYEDFLIDEQVQDENYQNVIRALNRLTPRQREAIYLRYFEDMDFENIAHVMDMNIQSVRNVIHRGIQVMRDLMLLQVFFMMLSKAVRY
jgi:RNA polymerase sigma factor (sigma-70 family)